MPWFLAQVYAADLYSARTAEAMVARLAQLCSHIAAHPSTTPLSGISCIPGGEWQKITKEFNRWGQEAEHRVPTICMHDRLATNPKDAIAVVYGNESLTYGALWRLAGWVAHDLQRAGVLPEAMVGIHMDRCVLLLVAIVGVMRSGGAYVPLELTLPQQRGCWGLWLSCAEEWSGQDVVGGGWRGS